MEEVGRAVMPGPYPATVLLGGAAIADAGSPAQRAGVAAAHRRRAKPRRRSLGPSRTPAGTPPGSPPTGARVRRRVHAVGHQDVCSRRASGRCAGGRGPHPRRQHDGGRGQPVPGAEGRGRGRASSCCLRSTRPARPARSGSTMSRVPADGAARRIAPGLGAAVARRRSRRGGAGRPRCAGPHSGCST